MAPMSTSSQIRLENGRVSNNLYQTAYSALIRGYKDLSPVPTMTAAPNPNLEQNTQDVFLSRLGVQPAGLQKAFENLSQTALSLSNGEIPEDVRKQVTQAAAESGGALGLSPAQTLRLTARDLGTTSLQLSTVVAPQLVAQAKGIINSEMAAASDSALGQANLEYERWAAAEQQKLATWVADTNVKQNFWSGVASLFTGAAAANQQTLLANQQLAYQSRQASTSNQLMSRLLKSMR